METIHIDNGGEVLCSPELIVLSPTGDYDALDMIELALRDSPNECYCRRIAGQVPFEETVS